jgi:hypothetical protein
MLKVGSLFSRSEYEKVHQLLTYKHSINLTDGLSVNKLIDKLSN